MDENTLEFDMVGIDAAIANAFRRILLAEVLGAWWQGRVAWGNLAITSLVELSQGLFFLKFC